MSISGNFSALQSGKSNSGASDRAGGSSFDSVFNDASSSKSQGADQRSSRAQERQEAREARQSARQEAREARAAARQEAREAREQARGGGGAAPAPVPTPPSAPADIPTTNGQILGGTTVAGATIDPVAGDFTRNGGDVPIADVGVEDLGSNADGTRNIRVSITNSGPEGGTFLTPPWVAIQDGTFDIYDQGEAAAEFLEALAEDGTVDAIGDAFQASGAVGAAGVITGPDGVAAGPLDPGETGSIVLTVDPAKSQFLNFASMVIPSNDAFISSPDDPTALQIFDKHGNFVGGKFEVTGADVLDAGTEVNTEQDAAFLNQTGPNTGIDEGGVVDTHPGFIGSVGLPATDAVPPVVPIPPAPVPTPPPSTPVGVPTTNGQILGGTTVAGATIDPVAGDFTRDGGDVSIANVGVEDLGSNADGTRNIRVSITNNGAEGSTFLTPPWVAIQDGTFDIYDRGEAAAPFLEALAEDGTTEAIGEAFQASGAVGAAGVITGPDGVAAGPLDPGETGSIVLTVDPAKSQFLNFASMVIPSNDAFISSPDDPTALQIFDKHGNFVGGKFEVTGADVLDAGTEVNTEQDAAFLNQTGPNTGIDEAGVVDTHPGFIGSDGLPATDTGARAPKTIINTRY